ncbi:hypothetical protein TNCV_1443151 [Trichonephila clavipes]|nr:hypothetical protein TNCV_1443151 [Trichonephila clavipes]
MYWTCSKSNRDSITKTNELSDGKSTGEMGRLTGRIFDLITTELLKAVVDPRKEKKSIRYAEVKIPVPKQGNPTMFINNVPKDIGITRRYSGTESRNPCSRLMLVRV